MTEDEAVVHAPGRNKSTMSSRAMTSTPHVNPITIVRTTPAGVPPEAGPSSAALPVGTASATLRRACRPLTGAVERPKQRQAVSVPRRTASAMPRAKASSRPVESQAPYRNVPGTGRASSPHTPNSKTTTAGASSRRPPGTGASSSTAAANSSKARRPETLLTADTRKSRPMTLLIHIER